MDRNTARAVAVMAVPVALGLAACGGPTKSSLVGKADTICRTTNLNATSKKPTSYPELADSARSLATATDDQVAKLQKLSVPGGDKATVSAVFGAIGGVAAAAHRLQDTAAKVDDKATAGAADDANTSAKDAADKAKAYGFTSCGTGTQSAVTPVFDGARDIVKSAFVAKAEAICKDANKKSDAVRKPSTSDLRSFGRYLDTIQPIYTKATADLHALAVPPGDEAAVSDMLAALEAQVAKANDVGAAAKANDRAKALAALDEVNVLTTAANAKADAYGVRACGSGSITS
ncbi:MAG: hypothetical protein ABR511_13805 [Acidimicrobiales bacterium]